MTICDKCASAGVLGKAEQTVEMQGLFESQYDLCDKHLKALQAWIAAKDEEED